MENTIIEFLLKVNTALDKRADFIESNLFRSLDGDFDIHCKGVISGLKDARYIIECIVEEMKGKIND